ncbi:MAG: adenylate/guanylate cyclase domain-containing protein [Bacteroidota bacterium]
MPSTHLFRDHTRIFLIGQVLHLLVAILAYYVVLAPSPEANVLWLFIPLLPAFVVALACEWFARTFIYRSLKILDGLSSEQRYAQNQDLSRGVVQIHNLPFLSALSVYVGRGLIFPLVYAGWAMVFAGFMFRGPWEAAAFMLMACTMVPLLPAVYEFYALGPLIEKRYTDMISYRGVLLAEWKDRIIVVTNSVRIVYVVAMLGVAPPLLLLSRGAAVRPQDAVLLGTCIVTIAVAIAMLMVKDVQRSIGILLTAMRQVERNRPPLAVSITTADEYSELADGMTRMIAGLKEQSFIRDTFGKYVPRAIVEAVLRNGVNLHGETRTVATLLVDIRQFRDRFDRSAPTEIVSLLNQYLASVTGAAQHYSGTIDKVVGDRVLVVFGAPVTLDQPVDRALFAALEIRKSMEKLNKKLTQKSGKPLSVVLNVHYGNVIAGHIGAAERWEYSIVGDAVSDTYHLNDLHRTSDQQILVSDPARAIANSGFVFGSTLPAPLVVKAGATLPVYPLVDHHHTPDITPATTGSSTDLT